MSVSIAFKPDHTTKLAGRKSSVMGGGSQERLLVAGYYARRAHAITDSGGCRFEVSSQKYRLIQHRPSPKLGK